MISQTRNKRARGAADEPRVVCVWCGAVIRSAAVKSARRMCQGCFARMMQEHNRAHQPQAGCRGASER